MLVQYTLILLKKLLKNKLTFKYYSNKIKVSGYYFINLLGGNYEINKS